MGTSLTIEFPSPDSAIAMTGFQEENLKLLAQQTGASIVLRGQAIVISGTENQVDQVDRLVRSLESYWGRGKAVTGVDIVTARHELNTQNQD